MRQMSSDIKTRLNEVRERVSAASRRAGRDSDPIVVAVTKTWPVDVIREAIEAGATDLGENRALELKEKIAALGSRARWHFIGHLQTNKVRHVAGAAGLIHSIDRFALAEGVARRARYLGVTQEILIQVNVARSEAKQGVEAPRLAALADEVAGLDGLSLRGIMTIPPVPLDPEDSRPLYREMATLSDALRARHPGADQISMGMSRDFEVAVEEGATILRIGEAIFGSRA